MRSGNYREKIKILVPELTINDFGEKVQDYKLLFETRANVNYNSGSRYVVNDEVFNDYTKTFTVRIYHTINEKMLILWDEKRWRITSIDKNKINQELIIQTELFNE